MPGKTISSLCACAAASAACLSLAPSALAGTISLSSACYVAPKIGEGATISVSGSGFTPGEEVFAQIPAPSGILSDVETTVTPEGTIAATLTDVSPASINPVAEKETMQIKGVVSEQILAEAPFELANLAVKLTPSSAKPSKKVEYAFSGFPEGATIYGHYVHKGKVVVTHDFGKTSGACGTLSTKSRIFPGKSRYSNYTVQFDSSKSYSASTSPKIDTSVSILRF